MGGALNAAEPRGRAAPRLLGCQGPASPGASLPRPPRPMDAHPSPPRLPRVSEPEQSRSLPPLSPSLHGPSLREGPSVSQDKCHLLPGLTQSPPEKRPALGAPGGPVGSCPPPHSDRSRPRAARPPSRSRRWAKQSPAYPCRRAQRVERPPRGHSPRGSAGPSACSRPPRRPARTRQTADPVPSAPASRAQCSQRQRSSPSVRRLPGPQSAPACLLVPGRSRGPHARALLPAQPARPPRVSRETPAPRGRAERGLGGHGLPVGGRDAGSSLCGGPDLGAELVTLSEGKRAGPASPASRLRRALSRSGATAWWAARPRARPAADTRPGPHPHPHGPSAQAAGRRAARPP